MIDWEATPASGMGGFLNRVSSTTSRAVIFVGLAILPGGSLADEKGGCQRETISISKSPDNSWMALVQEDTCSDVYFVTNITDTIQLTRRDDAIDAIRLTRHADEPKHGNDGFAVDEGGHPENRPLTRWLSASELQITIPNKSLIGLHKSSYEGIAIVVKFEPDDPTERERWLKSFGLPTK